MGGKEKDRFTGKLSIGKGISSARQKLPNNWERELVNMRGEVRAKQNPVKRADGTLRIAGVKDDHFVTPTMCLFGMNQLEITVGGKEWW